MITKVHTPPRAAYRQVDFLRDATLVVLLVYLLTGGLQRLILGGSSGFGGGSALNQVMTFLVLGSAGLCVLYLRVPLRSMLRGAEPFIIPVLLILISVMWSDYPSIGLRRAIRFVLELVGLVLLVSCYRESRSFLRALFVAFAILVVLDVLSFAIPRMSITGIGVAGVHGHKNTLGSFAYAAIPIFFIAWRRRLIGNWSFVSLGLMLVTGLLLVASLSKTAMFLAAVSAILAFMVYHVWRRGFTTQLAIGGLFSMFILLAALPIASSGMNLGELVGLVTGDPTMTGRAEVWDYTFRRVGERFITGVGYGSFWDVDPSAVALMNEQGVTFAFNQSHNGYIGVYAELGLLGVAAIVLMWVMATAPVLRRISNAREWPLVGYALYTAIGYAFYNITETSFFRVGFDTWIEYVIIMVATAKLVAVQPAAPQQAPIKAKRVRRVYRMAPKHGIRP
ncbi:MAG TPA: O-antigen ligase family protein [Verrucomicrobiae bacterium]|nr:O-antigen ligase family protein [Verrucomicrobiae bacterium]